MTIQVTIGKWYAVSGAAGATVTTPDGSITLCTIPDGGQGYFNAPTTSVETSDDTVKVTQATFNLALAGLGLLGGGVSELPKGAIRAEFLEFSGTQYSRTSLTIPNLRAQIKYQIGTTKNCAIASIYRNYTPVGHYGFHQMTNNNGAGAITSLIGVYVQQYDNPIGTIIEAEFDYSKQFCRVNKLTKYGTVTPAGDKPVLYLGAQNAVASNVTYGAAGAFFTGRIISFEAWYGTDKVADFVPILDNDGRPCFYNLVDRQPFYNSGTGSFIVGMAMKQARKLGKLPAGGGTLTVSLPTGYESDAGVMSALETARANGWTLTVQTYEAETAAATFGMRRIWVRRQQDENGLYSAQDGTRWQVDWCVEMYTPDESTPDMHGYEMFRSVEAAAAYWELQPYVYPEAEHF